MRIPSVHFNQPTTSRTKLSCIGAGPAARSSDGPAGGWNFECSPGCECRQSVVELARQTVTQKEPHRAPLSQGWMGCLPPIPARFEASRDCLPRLHRYAWYLHVFPPQETGREKPHHTCIPTSAMIGGAGAGGVGRGDGKKEVWGRAVGSECSCLYIGFSLTTFSFFLGYSYTLDDILCAVCVDGMGVCQGEYPYPYPFPYFVSYPYPYRALTPFLPLLGRHNLPRVR